MKSVEIAQRVVRIHAHNVRGGGLSFEDAEKSKDAGVEVGVGVRKIFTSSILSFVWFYITWDIAWLIFGMKSGLITDDTKNDPFWFQIHVLFFPIVLMVIFR